MKGHDLDDYQAIRRLKRGDISGLKTLVERYQVKATRTAYLITRDPATADKVMQAAFHHVYKAVGGFDIHHPFEPWLMRTVVKLALKTVPITPESWANEGMDDIGDAIQVAPTVTLQDPELEALLRGALDQLPPQQRAVLVLYYYLDYSEQEISAALERSPETIHKHLYSAQKQLQTLLRKGVDS